MRTRNAVTIPLPDHLLAREARLLSISRFAVGASDCSVKAIAASYSGALQTDNQP